MIFNFSSRVKLTAIDMTSDLNLSPISAFVSCPNWINAPRKRRIFTNFWLSWADNELASNADVAVGVTVGGGVVVGDELPCLFKLELRLGTDIIVVSGCIWCGDIGDRGATTLAPSGESGVHCSFPKCVKFLNYYYLCNIKCLFLFFCFTIIINIIIIVCFFVLCVLHDIDSCLSHSEIPL